MRFLPIIAAAAMLCLFVAGAAGQETNGFVCQTITLPAKSMVSRFVDLDSRGKADLLVIDPLAKTLLVYRQHAWGFTNTPDQVIQLPPQTGWVAPYLINTQAACELVASTGSGLVSYGQHGGAFDSEPRNLVNVAQVFTNIESPGLLSVMTNVSLPIISATQACLYAANEASQWTSGPPMTLTGGYNRWYIYSGMWSLGPDVSRSFHVYESAKSGTNNPDKGKPETNAVTKLMKELKQSGMWGPPVTTSVDLNDNGQKDLIVWQVLGELDFKTDLYVFLRGANGKLPDQPTQVLHCRGFPIPIGSSQSPCPVGHLAGDGTYQLVLLEPKLIASVSGFVDMAISQGIEMTLTIRTFNHGAFSRSADAAIPLKVLLSWYGTGQWPYFICGDFNGDGRPDLVVQRSSVQWEIYPSTTDGHWFNSHPAQEFTMPTSGYFERHRFEISDINGDGLSDIVLHDPDDPRIVVFLTQPRKTKGNP